MFFTTKVEPGRYFCMYSADEPAIEVVAAARRRRDDVGDGLALVEIGAGLRRAPVAVRPLSGSPRRQCELHAFSFVVLSSVALDAFGFSPLGPSTVHVIPTLMASRGLFCPPMVTSVREPETSAGNVLPSSSFKTSLARPSHSATAPLTAAAGAFRRRQRLLEQGDGFRRLIERQLHRFGTSSP